MQCLLRRLVSAWRKAPAQVFQYAGFGIPVDLMLLTGGGPETFDAISRQHIHNIERFAGLKPDYSVLEIGCGIGRDAIPLTTRLSEEGTYLGVDIIAPSIDWCRENITSRFPHFSFVHFDVKDQLHNPAGTMSALDVSVPLPSGTVDLIILQSVFTHLLRPEIVHYLHEFRRLLKPAGLVYATMFMFDDAVLASARATDLTAWSLTFDHEVDDGCRINDPETPTGAVAYSAASLDQMLKETGLRLARPLLHGGWSGYHQDAVDGQEVAIIEPAQSDRPGG